MKGNEIAAIAGKLADAESLVAVKDLLNRLGSGNLQVGWVGWGWRAGMAG